MPSYHEAIRLYPLLREAHVGKVKMLSKLKRYEDVLVACQEARELEVKDYGFREYQTEALYALKRYDEVIEIGEQEGGRHFLFLRGSTALYVAHALRARRRFEEACQAYRGAAVRHVSESENDREEYEWLLKEAKKGERAMLLLLGRFREAMDANYRDNRRRHKYFANRPLFDEQPDEGETGTEF